MYQLSYLFQTRYCVEKILYRQLATSLLCYKYNAQQISKLTLKFWAKDSAIKSRYRVPELPVPTSFRKQFTKERPEDNWRQKRLHKLLFEKITEAIATSELGTDLISKGLFITRLHITSSYLQVYWSSNNPENNEILADLLLKLVPVVRYEISTQRIIYRVPPIIFVLDEVQKLSDEVHRLLKIADLGDDFTSARNNSVSPAGTSSEQVVTPKSNPEGIEKMPNVESDFKTLTLRQDIFGVNRTKIMSLVKRKYPISAALVSEVSHEVEPRPSSIIEWNASDMSRHSRLTEIAKWSKQYKKSLKSKKNRVVCVNDGEVDVQRDFNDGYYSADEVETMEDDLPYYDEDDYGGY